jgi:DNA-binding NtrC family response regulator
MIDVLVIDDEINFLKDLAEGLRLYSKKIYVITTSNAEKALEILKTAKIDVVLTDLKMPGIGGIEFVKQVCTSNPHLPVIIMSACARMTVDDKLPGLKLAGYLEKPVGLHEIADAILYAANYPGHREKKQATGHDPIQEIRRTHD